MTDQQDPNQNPNFDQGSTPNDPTQIHNLSDLNPVDPDATAEHPAVPQDPTAAIPVVDPASAPAVEPAADPYAANQSNQVPPNAPGYNQAGYQASQPVDEPKKNLTALWVILAVLAAAAIGLGAAALFSNSNDTPTPVIETQTVTPTVDPTTPTFEPTTPTVDPTTPTFEPTTPTGSIDPLENSGSGKTPKTPEASATQQGFEDGGRANSAP